MMSLQKKDCLVKVVFLSVKFRTLIIWNNDR